MSLVVWIRSLVQHDMGQKLQFSTMSLVILHSTASTRIGHERAQKITYLRVILYSPKVSANCLCYSRVTWALHRHDMWQNLHIWTISLVVQVALRPVIRLGLRPIFTPSARNPCVWSFSGPVGWAGSQSIFTFMHPVCHEREPENRNFGFPPKTPKLFPRNFLQNFNSNGPDVSK